MKNKKNISIKMWKVNGEFVLAACDSELLGKEFKEGELTLSVYESFYHERYVDKEEFISYLKSATIINLVGKRVINIAIEEGIVDKNNILYINKIPHAQAVLMLK
ncbi:MAG: DUF424 domain-containing protein [Thermoplasmata archaeon]|jgi:hypothetical protein